MKQVLSPRELAEGIGVSESSVKRWVDDGHLEAAKTAGGHRRISVQEAARYVRERSIPLLRPDVLGLAELTALAGVDSLSLHSDEAAARFFEYLRAGAEAEARGLLFSLFLDGWSVAEIVDGPLRAAMARIGELWTKEPSGVFWEHRATQIAIQSLGRLRSLLKVSDEAAFTIGGAASGDPYILPSMAVAAVLEGEGLRAVNLGAETPAETLALGIEDLDAKLAWLSVSVAVNPRRLRDDVLRLLPALEARGTPLVVGGVHAKKLGLPKRELLYIGGSMAELEALVKGMKLARG